MTSSDALRIHSELAEFYARPAVQVRFREFLGAAPTGRPSAARAAAYGGVRWLREPEGAPVPRAIADVGDVLEEGADLHRSVADERGTLLVLDVAYVNPADPTEAWRDPAACLARLAPAHAAARAAFARRGVDPLVVLEATGYRYLARIPLGSRLHERLAALGRAEPWGVAPPGGQARAGSEAHRAAGRVVERIAHEVLTDARPSSPLGTVLADVPPPAPAPYIRVDPTLYANPALEAFVRCPFSSDQTPLVEHPGTVRPFVITLPCRDAEDVWSLLALRTDPRAAATYAESAPAAIPDVPDHSSLLDDYESSDLATFHFEMDAAPRAAECAASGAGLFDTESMPPCANAVLRHPNPRLLQPRHLRTVALALWSVGWHPRAVAALVRSRFEEPHEWGGYWQRHDAAHTAEYLVRLFCAAASLGLDDNRFTCDTQSRLGLCPPAGCGYDLGLLFGRLRTLRARYEAHA